MAANRNLSPLENTQFDLLVIGGGIHGSCIAWDAALRGLSVALVEKGDFGEATSANSLKTVHGGLRYLQDANLQLVRLMIQERKALLRIAPHLVHPLPCIMPTYNRLMKSKPVMSVALRLNDLIGFDRNQDADPEKQLPSSEVISRQECLELLPGLPDEGVTGGAIWYDGQIYDTERLTLSFVLSAEKRGAVVANYLKAIGFIRQGDRVAGVRAQDMLTGDEIEIRASIVANAAGPWVDDVLEGINSLNREKKFHHSLAMNLVTDKFIEGYAAGVLSRPNMIPGSNGGSGNKGRMLFISPWRDYSLVGTFHAYYDGNPGEFELEEEVIQKFIDETNSAYPEASLSLEKVRLVHKGLLPAESRAAAENVSEVKLVRAGQIYDHQREDGLSGLVTVVGVKYTSSRHAAEKAVDLILNKLGKEPSKCKTHDTPLHGGQIERFSEFLSQAVKTGSNRMPGEQIKHLVYSYGTEYTRLLDTIRAEDGNSRQTLDRADVLRAMVLFAIREEKAQKLTDVILRRTGLGSAGVPDAISLQCCADTMQQELAWDNSRPEAEMAEVLKTYPLRPQEYLSRTHEFFNP